MDAEYVQILDDCETELCEIKTWAANNPVDSKLRYLNAYAVVRSSGAIEVSLKRMIYNWLSENGKGDAKTYLEKMIVDSSSHPRTGVMLRFLQDFNSVKKSRFESDIGSSLQDKSNLNSLVQWRNDIAHGRTISAGITAIYNDFLSGRTVLEKFYNVLTDASS